MVDYPGARRSHGLFHPPRRAMRRELSQLLCAVVGFGLGLFVAQVEAGPQVAADGVGSMLFTFGFGVISLVSIIYSVLFLVVQFSASTFTPRLGLFRDDPIVWRTFAFAVGVFVFCVTTGLAAIGQEDVSVVLPAAAVVLSLLALWFMRTLQARAFTSIQLAPSLAAIAEHAHHVMDVLYTRPYAAGGAEATGTAVETGEKPGEAVTLWWTGQGAVLQQIDVPRLVEAARRADAVVVLYAGIGDTLGRGRPVGEIRGGDLPEAVVRRRLLTGVERTLGQDPELPFRLLADIALRALSSAVNDPATAVQTLDHVEELLIRLADRDLAIGHVTDPQGAVRLIVPVPDWERYVRTAVDDVIVAAVVGAPMALLRVRALLTRVLDACPEVRRPVVADRLDWVEELGAERHPRLWTPGPRRSAC